GYVGQEQAFFGDKALRLPAKNAPEAAARVVRRFNDERTAGEAFRSWMERSGGAKVIAEGLRDLDEFPDPAEHPEYYADYDATGPEAAPRVRRRRAAARRRLRRRRHRAGAGARATRQRSRRRPVDRGRGLPRLPGDPADVDRHAARPRSHARGDPQDRAEDVA